jgi:hypothetical protein
MSQPAGAGQERQPKRPVYQHSPKQNGHENRKHDALAKGDPSLPNRFGCEPVTPKSRRTDIFTDDLRPATFNMT